MEQRSLMHRLIAHLHRSIRHIFGLERGLVDLFRSTERHRTGLAWGGLVALLHLAAGSHDTLSLLAVFRLKPEWHSIHLVESGLAVLVWLGHLLDD